ncbi:MAG: HD-GYP domain-containing protein [Desulfobulbaceae bacterium]|nr:MAG: HD-GYP domain-containing protein [Desulfobulbaceae bacterium]
MPHSNLNLQTFIHRTLALRLALMTIAICTLTAAGVFAFERNNLREEVMNETRAETQRMIARTIQIIRDSNLEKRDAFRQALAERTHLNLQTGNGSYVYVCFFEAGSPEIEERLDSGYPLAADIADYVHSHPSLAPPQQQLKDILWFDGLLHVQVVLPLKDPANQTIGYARAIFAPSESARTSLQGKLRRSVLLVIGIVLGTSALLYPVILQLFGRLSLSSRNLLEANLDTLSMLASTIAKRDSDTDIHNFRVTLYAVHLAEALHLPAGDIQSLIKGAFLHDIGKIGIRDAILLKEGALSEEELSLMREHVRHGLDILGDSQWFRDGAGVVGSHHEKFDGSGYPQGIAGEDIPLLARIFAIVDVFDALTARRPYKEPMSCDEALAELAKGRGSHFDPQLLDIFRNIAPGLYRIGYERDDRALRNDLKDIIDRYFIRNQVLQY